VREWYLERHVAEKHHFLPNQMIVLYVLSKIKYEKEKRRKGEKEKRRKGEKEKRTKGEKEKRRGIVQREGFITSTYFVRPICILANNFCNCTGIQKAGSNSIAAFH
jgi:hypothetical protein